MFATLRSPTLRALPVVALLAAAACGDDARSASADPHEELRRRLDLGSDVPIHRVTLGGRGASEHVVPRRLEVISGAVVEFRTVDGRVHVVEFPGDSLSPITAEFLRESRQLESPPLVDRGSRFVVSFRGAPAGRYLFRSRGSGGEAWGEIVVRGR